MKNDDYSGNCWPKDQHLLLMQAALLDGDKALNAWHQWISTVDIDKLDYPSYQIIPLLYHNLKKMQISHPAMNIFKGIHQRTWVENQRMTMLFSDVVQQLISHGIDEIVLMKGGAMIALYYQDFGMRQMGDIDFLVRPECVQQVMQCLTELGFKGENIEHKMNTQHAVNLMCDSAPFKGLNIDLHWSMLYQIPLPNIDPHWVLDAEKTSLHGVKLLALSPTHLLYQTCIHGSKYSPLPLTRWVLDAHTILSQKKNVINWDALIERVDYDRTVFPMLQTLSFLIDHFDSPVPSHVLERLRASPILRFERWHTRFSQHKWLSLTLIFPRLWHEHQRMLQGASTIKALINFPVFLQHKFSLNSVWALFFFLPTKSIQVIQSRIFSLFPRAD